MAKPGLSVRPKHDDTDDKKQAQTQQSASSGSSSSTRQDTPENRQAFLDEWNKRTGSLPDTPENRQRFLREQVGFSTSDSRTYKLTDDQIGFVSKRYADTWQYLHTAEDLAAQQQGYLPPSMYSKYNEKSAYDQWAVQAGMPNEKELEKYLAEYDEYKADVDAFASSYNARASLMSSFYKDVGDRLYDAEFKGVKRGSDEWFKVFDDAIHEDAYSALLPYYTGHKNEIVEAALGVATPEEESEPDAETVAREKWGDLFPSETMFPKLQVDADEFLNSYTTAVTGSEAAHGVGAIADGIRDAASRIRTDVVRDPRSFIWPSEQDTTYRLANSADTVAVCRDLALSDGDSDYFWSVISGLMNENGGGLVFDETTQNAITAYGQVVSNRFSKDILALSLGGKTSRGENLNTFVARAVEQGATRERLEKAYELAAFASVTKSTVSSAVAYGVTGQVDKALMQRIAFKASFEDAISTAPSIPVGSGWYDKLEDKEDVADVAQLRAGFDLEEQWDSFDNDERSMQAARDYYASESQKIEEEVERARQEGDGEVVITDSFAGSVDQYRNYLYDEMSVRVNRAAAAVNTDLFREAAKENGYSDWEVDQFFRRKGIFHARPEETAKAYNYRLANHYRDFLIEDALASSSDPASQNVAVAAMTEWLATMSDDDLVHMMKVDERTDQMEGAWALAPVMMIARGIDSFVAQFVNLADMVFNSNRNDDGSWEIAEKMNRHLEEMSAFYRHNNQSGFVRTITDAGSELVRMYLTAKAGGLFGKAVGGALGGLGTTNAAAAAASTFLSSGTKVAKLVKWGIESVPFVTGAMGSSYAEARAKGATNRQAAVYGVLAGTVEGLTEKMGADIVFGKLGNAAIGGLMKSGAKKILTGKFAPIAVNLIKMGMNAGSEAVEEGSAYILDYFLEKAIFNPDAEFSLAELGEQMGMGALCGAMGLAFQNYGASYVNSMLEFALSSPKNLQTFADFALNQYGVNLGTDGNYVVQPSDFDATKILSKEDLRAAWAAYLDSNQALQRAQAQYDKAVESLNADDAEKARQVRYWQNQVAAFDADDPKSAKALVNAMEQLVVSERAQADTAKKNQKLREDARTELTRARASAQNAINEAAAKVRAHSRSAIAATLGVVGDTGAVFDSSYDISLQDLFSADEENARQHYDTVEQAMNALDQLEQAEAAQYEAKAKLVAEATNAFIEASKVNPTVKAALDKVNRMAYAQETIAQDADLAADAWSDEVKAENRRQASYSLDYTLDLELNDSWLESELDQVEADLESARQSLEAGEISQEQFNAISEQAVNRIDAARSTWAANRDAAAESYAAKGGQSEALQGVVDAFRLDADTARAKAENIRNAVVRAFALRTQEAALAAVDEVVTGESVLTVEQREALTDELNRLAADKLYADEATQAVLDALDTIEEAQNRKTETSAQTPSEAQEQAKDRVKEKSSKTSEAHQAELDKAQAIGKMLGVDVQIVDDLPDQIAGRYTSGTIYISKNADNAPLRVLVHEITHYLEDTAAYSNLEAYVFGAMKSDPNFVGLDAEIASYRALYAQTREQLGQEQLSDEEATKEAKAEIVARWCEKNLFTNERSINRLTASQAGLGKRILNGIQNMLSGHRTDPASADLRTAEKLYIKALNAAKAFGGAKNERNSVVSLAVAAGLYVDTTGDAVKFVRTRYDTKGNRTLYEELTPNYDSPCDGPITTDDIMNHSPIGAFIRLAQEYGTIPKYNETELVNDVNLRAIPTSQLSTPAKIVNLFTDLANMCLAYGDNQMVWDFVGGYVYSAITANSDPQYSRTVDYGSVCRKTQNLVTAMSEAMKTKGRGLSAAEIIELSNKLVVEGQIDQPCSMCYVFNRWLGLGGYLNRIKVYQDRYAAMTPADAMNAFEAVQASLDQILTEGKYESLVRELSAKCGLDANTYLEQMPWTGKSKEKLGVNEARKKSVQIYSTFLDDCAQNLDRKGVANPDEDPVYQDIMQRMELTDAYGWFTKVLLNSTKSGKHSFKSSVLSDDKQSWRTDASGKAVFVVPSDVLFDINASDRFSSEYPDVWSFRTGGGPSLGKAAYGYADARLGEFTYGAAVSKVKSQDVPKAPRYGIGTEKSTSKNQPKNKLSFANSLGEFAAAGKAIFKKAYQNVLNQAWLGGDRMQSSTDFMSKNALDYLITAFEMQCLGAPVQTYSKVKEGLAFFDMIGASANASLISPGKGYTGNPVLVLDPKTNRYGVRPGSAEIVLSTVQGVDPDYARELSATSNSVQPICVAMNREHLAVILSTPWITMTIPVHLSGSKVEGISARAVAQGDPALSRGDVVDATYCQNDKVLTDDELSARYDPETIERIKTARKIRRAILSGELASRFDLSEQLQNFPMLAEMYEYYKQSGAKVKVNENEEKDPLGFSIYPNEYWDRTSTIENADVNGDRFISYCEMLGVLPRFSYGAYGEQGTEGQPGYWPGAHRLSGYWKALIDRKMYKADGTFREVGPVDVSTLTAQMLSGKAKADAGNVYNVTENADMSKALATATRVGREYGASLVGTAEEDVASRYALAGDVDAKLAELRKQFGAMSTTGTETAPGRENVALPRQTTEDTYVRRAAQTFMRSPNVTDAAASEIGRDVIKGDFNYSRQTNAETMDKAHQKIVDLGGHANALTYLENVVKNHGIADAATVAMGEQLILDAQEAGDANAFEKAVIYTSILGTSAGQATQAFGLINKLSPQGVALYINRVLERLNNVDYAKLIAKGKMRPLKLTEEQTKKLLDVHTFADAKRVQTEILEDIASQIPLTVGEQLRNWRYLCMLGNVRTNVRNVMGNLAMSSMRMGRDVVAAAYEALDVRRGKRLLEKAAAAEGQGDTEKAQRLAEKASRHLATADRTKTIQHGDAYRANKAFARSTLEDAEAALAGGGKDVGLDALQHGKRMFNPKLLNKVGKTVLKPLDIMDVKFLQPLYINSYAQWMTARGLTPETITFRQKNEAMKYSIQEAQEATFRDANWLASKLTELRSRNLAAEALIGSVVPFAKTPMNIVRRGIEYSPAGLLQGMAQLHKANTDTSLSRGEQMALRAKAISRLASGTIGTGLLALGMFLRAKGLLRGGADKDSRAAKFMRDIGLQTYSLKFGNVTLSADWLAPLNMPVFMGSAIYDVAESLAQGEEVDWKDISESLMSIADPMIEMSMLQSLRSAIKTYGSDDALSAVLTNMGESLAGQFYPTILGQIARTGDLTRRSPDSKKYWIQSMIAKIPGLSTTVKPYIGGYGEEEVYDLAGDSDVGNYLLRGLEQMFAPGYVKVAKSDDLTKELIRLYEATGVSTFLPQRPSDYQTINLGKKYGVGDVTKVPLTYEQQVEYDKLSRSMGTQAMLDVINSDVYKGLDDGEKADALTEAYNAGVKAAREEYKKKLHELLQQQENVND